MGVGIQGKAGLGVAQNAGEGLGVHSGGQGVGSERVPQIMEPKAGQSSLLQQFFESAVCTAGIYRPLRSERVRKDPLGQSRCPPFLQKLGGAVRKQNCPLSRICECLLSFYRCTGRPKPPRVFTPADTAAPAAWSTTAESHGSAPEYAAVNSTPGTASPPGAGPRWQMPQRRRSPPCAWGGPR